MRLIRKPTWIAAAMLFTLYVMAIYFRAEPGFIFREPARITAVVAGFALPAIVSLILSQSRPQLPNLIITTLILLLIADPSSTPWQMFVLGFITSLIKSLLRPKHQPIFNPTAAGLLASSFFGVAATWWGASFSPRLPVLQMSVSTLLIIPVGLYLVLLYKKLPTLIGVPTALTLVYWLLTRTLPVFTLLEGTFIFFLMIMATEPRTTPLIDWQEWIYALALGAMLGFLFVHRIFGEPYLWALLIMNLLYSISRFATAKSPPGKGGVVSYTDKR